MSTPRRAGHTSPRHDPTRTARLQRDASMERGRTITKGLALGSVAAVAVAGVYLSQALPGHSASTGSSSNGTAGAATPVAPTANSGNSGTAPTANSGNSGTAPSAPASAPAPAYNQAPVVSSGSS